MSVCATCGLYFMDILYEGVEVHEPGTGILFHCNNCYYSWQESEQRRLSAKSEVDPNKRSVWYYEPLIRDVPIRNMDRKGHYDEVKNFNSLCFRTILPCTDLQLYRCSKSEGLEDSASPESTSLLREFVTAGGLYSGDKAPVVDLKPRFDVDAVKARPWGDGYDPETGDDILSFEFLGSVEMLTRGKRKEDWSFRFGYSDGVCIDWNSLEFEVPEDVLITDDGDEELGLWAPPEVLCPPWMKNRFTYYTSELLSYDIGRPSINGQPDASGQGTPPEGKIGPFTRRKRLPSSYRPTSGSMLLPKGMVTPNRKGSISTLAASPVTPGSVTPATSKATPKAVTASGGGKSPSGTPSRTEASMAALKEKLAGFQAKAKAAAVTASSPTQAGLVKGSTEGLRPLNTSPWAPPHPPSKSTTPNDQVFRTPTEWQHRSSPREEQQQQILGSNSKRPVGSSSRNRLMDRTDSDKRRRTERRSRDSPRSRESSVKSDISEPLERESRDDVMMADDLDISPRARLSVRDRRNEGMRIGGRRRVVDIEAVGTMARAAAAEAAYSSSRSIAATMPSASLERSTRAFGKGLRGRERSGSPASSYRLHAARRPRTSGPRNAFDTGGPRNALDAAAAAPIREQQQHHHHRHREGEQGGNRSMLGVEKLSPPSSSSDTPMPSFPPPPPGIIPRAAKASHRTIHRPKSFPPPPPGLPARHENRGRPGGRMGGGGGGPRSMFGAAMQSVLRQSGGGGERR